MQNGHVTETWGFLYVVEALLLAASLNEWMTWVYSILELLSAKWTYGRCQHGPGGESSNVKHRTTSQKKAMSIEPPSRTSTFVKRPIILTYLLTYSMVQSPSWEANWFAASQEIPRISRNPKVHYRTHKRPPPISILGQPNPVHIPTFQLLEIHPNIIHPSTPRPPQWSLSLRFPHQEPMHLPSPHPYVPHAQLISFFTILSPAQYWVRTTNHLAPHYAISSIPPLHHPS